MRAERRNIRLRIISLSLALFATSAAKAATATFVSPATMDYPSLYAVQTADDSKGYTVGLSTTFSLVFDAPFASVRNAESVTIFTLAPTTGTARATISFGVYNNGSPTIVATRVVNAGAAISVSNLYQSGCSVFGGCDFISITTTRATGAAAGVTVDYVDINGEIVEIAAPAPEPELWTLTLLAAVGVAARLRAQRRRRDARLCGNLPAPP